MSRSAGWIQNYDRSAEEYKEEPNQSNQIMNEKGLRKMEKINFEIKRYVYKEMTRRFPYKELEYRNSIVASIMANGHGEKMTEDWLLRTLLGDMEDGFITYGQIMTIKDDYMKAIEDIKKMF